MLLHPIDQHPQPSSVTPPLHTQLQWLGMFSPQLEENNARAAARAPHASSIVPIIVNKDVPARLSQGLPRFSSDCESEHLGTEMPSLLVRREDQEGPDKPFK
eukprot:1320970-Rhodomonas_salina.1